ncbi:MAG: hypothetical protein QM733_09510 [Ilumatobacteraceae bacterium]
MPAQLLDALPVSEPTVMVVPWHDPVVEAVGYDVHSTYVELFWLNVLGPTATWLLRRLARGLDRHPLGYELDLADTAGALGLGYVQGATNPFLRALHRCVLFGVAQPYDGSLAVRRRLPPVAGRHLLRMPSSLRETHAEWIRPRHEPAAATGAQDERARIFVAAMTALGDEPEVIERQLLALGFNPTLVTELTGLG